MGSKRKRRINIFPNKWVCGVDDLNKLLPKELKQEFQKMFYTPLDSTSSGLLDSSTSALLDSTGSTLIQRKEAWRMFYKGNTPRKFLSRLGIDIDNPTVRDAVAFDLVKLDDGSVSNDSEYTYREHVRWSPSEYDRFLLHKNYRINLVNLEPEWCKLKPRKKQQSDSTDEHGEDKIDIERSVNRVW